MEWYEYAFKVPGRRNRYSSVLVKANSKLEACTKAREAFPEVLKAGTNWLCYNEAEGDAVKALRRMNTRSNIAVLIMDGKEYRKLRHD